MKLTVNVLTIEKTCSSHPEQYDVFHFGEQIGYLRLRHGVFTAVADGGEGKEVVYTAEPDGDGAFYDEERERYVSAACAELLHYINRQYS